VTIHAPERTSFAVRLDSVSKVYGSGETAESAPGEHRGAQASGQTADRLPCGLGTGADAGFPGPGGAHSFGEHVPP
jgi:hypothetical protein